MPACGTTACSCDRSTVGPRVEGSSTLNGACRGSTSICTAMIHVHPAGSRFPLSVQTSGPLVNRPATSG